MKTAKTLFLLAFTSLLFIACKNQPQRYTRNSPEIDTFKKSIKDYGLGNWESMKSHYADTAKIIDNVPEKKGISVDENIKQIKNMLGNFSSYGFIADKNDFEMVLTDDGHTWVNFWGVWQGLLKANNQLLEVPVHLTSQFVNGKIVKEFGYWDNAPIVLAMQKIQAEKKISDN